MNDYELYDKILRELPKDGSLSSASDYNEMDLRYLMSCGYLDGRDTEFNGLYLICITATGLRFISEGGFTEQARIKEVAENDARLQRENWEATTKAARRATTIAWLSLGVSLAAAILALIK